MRSTTCLRLFQTDFMLVVFFFLDYPCQISRFLGLASSHNYYEELSSKVGLSNERDKKSFYSTISLFLWLKIVIFIHVISCIIFCFLNCTYCNRKHPIILHFYRSFKPTARRLRVRILFQRCKFSVIAYSS